MSVAVGRAAEGDCDALTALAHAAKRSWGYAEDLIRLWRADLTVRAALVRGGRVYVATDAGEIVGFYALGDAPPALELEHLWVRPDRMRQGVGTTLLAHAIVTARAAGATAITIASDPNAVGFYERMGARRVGEVPSTPAGRVLPLLRLELR
jgi:ribosomal protein S18 acetylase RimI-like enzyme